jgi:uncharacterized beta-barrel protein YwiB (DUF1934 family)
MDKEVVISVRGSQIVGDTRMGVMELMTLGKYYKKENSYYITYNENEQFGVDFANTMLEVSDGTLKFLRHGLVNAQFIFQQGKRHISHYDTPHGSFTVSLFTNNVDIDIDDSGGEINIDYMFELDNGHSAVNDFHVTIREPGKRTGAPGESFFT